jgi:hypothetical protein
MLSLFKQRGEVWRGDITRSMPGCRWHFPRLLRHKNDGMLPGEWKLENSFFYRSPELRMRSKSWKIIDKWFKCKIYISAQE